MVLVQAEPLKTSQINGSGLKLEVCRAGAEATESSEVLRRHGNKQCR